MVTRVTDHSKLPRTTSERVGAGRVVGGAVFSFAGGGGVDGHDVSMDAAYHRTLSAQIHLLKRRYRGGPCLCPAVAAPPQLAVEPC
jgi:hypothetical protein